jgi:hypothetical protein
MLDRSNQKYLMPLINMIVKRLFFITSSEQPTDSTGSIVFDGLGDDGKALRMGIYIIFLEVLNDNSGIVETIKSVVMVARKL